MHPFRAYISMHSQLTAEDWSIIESCLSYKVIQENRIILKPGAICENLYFLENGTIRYFILKNKEDITTHLISPPSLFTSPHSFSKQTPSIEGIQAMEESYIWIISREDVQKLLEIPSWKGFLSSI